MAVGYDTSASGTGTSLSITLGASANVLLVFVSQLGGSTTAVTYNGVSMTSVTSAVSAGDPRIYCYRLVNPGTGSSYSVSVTASGYSSIGIVAISLTGADTSTPVEASTTTSGYTPNISNTINSTSSGSMVVDGVYAYQTSTANSGQTSRQTVAIGAYTAGVSTKPGNGNIATGWTNSNNYATYIQVSIKAASGTNYNDSVTFAGTSGYTPASTPNFRSIVTNSATSGLSAVAVAQFGSAIAMAGSAAMSPGGSGAMAGSLSAAAISADSGLGVTGIPASLQNQATAVSAQSTALWAGSSLAASATARDSAANILAASLLISLAATATSGQSATNAVASVVAMIGAAGVSVDAAGRTIDEVFGAAAMATVNSQAVTAWLAQAQAACTGGCYPACQMLASNDWNMPALAAAAQAGGFEVHELIAASVQANIAIVVNAMIPALANYSASGGLIAESRAALTAILTSSAAAQLAWQASTGPVIQGILNAAVAALEPRYIVQAGEDRRAAATNPIRTAKDLVN